MSAAALRKKTVCPLDCPDSCAMIATVEGGRVTKLQGDTAHPYTSGFICRKMGRYPERFYGKSRLLYPQVRTGVKGSGQFRRTSWEEALELVAARLEDTCARYGGESILPYSYAGNMGAVNRFAGYPLFHKLGASRLDQTICSATAGAGWSYHCTDMPGTPPENCRQARLIIAWGINIKVSNVHFWQYVAAARKRGGRLVVIDPYCNQTARTADRHLRVLPGGDVALALGLAKHLLEATLADDNPGEACNGYQEWKRYLLQLDWLELVRESGISRKQIVQLAEELAREPKTFVRIGIGLSRNSRGGMAVRAISALGALLGLYEGGEGRGILLTSGAFQGDSSRLTYPQLAPSQTRLVNMIHLGRALTSLDPPVQALVVYNANPLSVNPDSSQVLRGLQRQDLFTVVHEQVMTPTAKYADVLLPATTFLENLDIYTSYGHFYVGVAQPAVEPYGEARSNFDFFQALAGKMGFDDPPFQQSCEERLLDYLDSLQGLPDSCKRGTLLDGEYRLSERSCVSRKRSSWQRSYSFINDSDHRLPAYPALTPAGESADPDLLSRFPLQLITPPHPDLLNSTFGEMYSDFPGEVLVHPTDAENAQVQDGKLVTLENLRGKTRRFARITEDTQQGVVVAEGIFWHASTDAEDSEQLSGVNSLTSQKLADMGGGATFHESRVKISALP